MLGRSEKRNIALDCTRSAGFCRRGVQPSWETATNDPDVTRLQHDDEGKRALYLTLSLPERDGNRAVGRADIRSGIALGDPLVGPVPWPRCGQRWVEGSHAHRQNQSQYGTNLPAVHFRYLVSPLR